MGEREVAVSQRAQSAGWKDVDSIVNLVLRKRLGHRLTCSAIHPIARNTCMGRGLSSKMLIETKDQFIVALRQGKEGPQSQCGMRVEQVYYPTPQRGAKGPLSTQILHLETHLGLKSCRTRREVYTRVWY
jgi:hypothetical protein